jgi:hypothetical protein
VAETLADLSRIVAGSGPSKLNSIETDFVDLKDLALISHCPDMICGISLARLPLELSTNGLERGVCDGSDHDVPGAKRKFPGLFCNQAFNR